VRRLNDHGQASAKRLARDRVYRDWLSPAGLNLCGHNCADWKASAVLAVYLTIRGTYKRVLSKPWGRPLRHRCTMANGTVVQSARMALQGDVLEIVVRLIGRQDRVWATVAGFAVEAAVSHESGSACPDSRQTESRGKWRSAEIDPRPPSWICQISR